MGEGDDGGIGFGGDDGAGIGPAGPGPSEGAESDSDYGGAFGGMAGITGADGSGSDLGNILGLMSNQTDLSQAFNDFGLDAMSFDSPDLSQGMPDVSTSNDTSWQDTLSKMAKASKAVSSIMGLLGKSNALSSAMSSTPVSMAMSNNPLGTFAQSALGIGLGPMGALAGMGLNAMGAFDGLAGAGNVSTPQGNEGNSGMDFAGALPGLAGLYAGYQGQKQSGDMLGGLQSLYSQNSPYAQVMRQQLQRQDAAGGRRSQYGPREVELQAKLAQMASNQIPAMSQIGNNRTMQRNQMLQQGLGAFTKLGGVNALRDLFSQGRGGMFETSAMNALNNGSLQNPFDLSSVFSNLPPSDGFNFSWD